MVQPMIRPETLELILLGNLPQRELERLGPEIENDPNLEQLASRTVEGDELLNLLRTRIQSDTLDPDERVESLKSRLKELREMLPREIRFPFLAPPQADDEIGRLGIYRVRELLGEGGMGFVFLAEDPSLNRTVALKVMKPNIAALPDHRERFLREARNAAAVENERVVPIYHIGEQGGVPFFAMPHLKGESLASRLGRETKLSLTEVLRIGREIAEGLAAAHEKGMIHRDVQPGNVWLEAPNDRVKLLDFGLSRNTSADVHLTQPGLMLGTPAFMAPEQARNREVDSRADLFSLGILLYRMSTGRSPFDGTDLISTLISVAVDEPTPPDVPAPLAQLMLKLLAKKAEDRPSSATEVAGLLARLEADPTRSLVPSARTKPPARGRFRVALALLFLLILGGFGAYQIVLKTENGTLVVDVSDPQVEARFKDGEVKLYDAKGELKYTLKPSDRNKKLPPGQYKISVTGGDGLKLDTDQFEIRNGDSVTVRVSLEAPAVAKKDEPKGVPPDPVVMKEHPEPKIEKIDPVEAARAVAEWAIVNRGKVVVDVKGQLTEVSLRSKLPDEAFRVKTLRYPEGAPLDNETLRTFLSLDRLDRIEILSTSNASEEQPFLHWVGQSELNRHISEIAFLAPERPSGFGSEPSGSPSEGFSRGSGPGSGSPRGSLTSPALLSTLKLFRSLKKIEFEDFSFDGSLFQSFKELRELDELRLSNCRLQDDWMYDLRGVKAKVLHLDRNLALTDESSGELLRKAELQELNLRKTKFSANGILNLSKGLPKCKILSDHGTFQEGKQIAKVPMPPEQAMSIIIAWMPQNGGQVVVEYQGKRVAVTSEMPVFKVDSKLGSPANFWNDLKIVSITFPAVTEAPEAMVDALESLGGVERFEFTSFPSSTAWLQGKLRSLPTEVCFTKCRISASSQGTLFEPKGFTRLKKVSLDQCNLYASKSGGGGASFSLNFVKTLPPLETFALTDCGLQNEHVPMLRDIRTRNLILDRNPALTDECVPELLKWLDLKELSLKGTKITPEGISQLKKSIPAAKISSDHAEPKGTNRNTNHGTTAPEKVVARWVLESGGYAVIRLDDASEPIRVDRLDRLPVGDFRIVSLMAILPVRPSEEAVKALESLPPFRELVLAMPANSDEAWISGLPEKLRSLPAFVTIDNGKFKPSAFSRFKQFSRLEGLSFVSCSWAATSPAEMRTALGELPALKTLDLTACGVENYWFAGLLKQKLDSLTLDSNIAVTDRGIDDLVKLSVNKELSVKGTSITRDGLKKLKRGLPATAILNSLESPAKPAPTTVARQLAEWVLSRGHAVTIESSGKQREVNQLSQLPREPFILRSISWPIDLEKPDPNTSPAEIEIFSSFRELTALDRIEIRDKHTLYAILWSLGLDRTLPTEISIIGGDFKVEIPLAREEWAQSLSKQKSPAVHVLSYFSSLQKLSISACSLEGRPFKGAETPLKVDRLTFSKIPGPTDWLADLDSFRFNSLILDDNAKISDSDIPALLKFTDLKELSLRSTALTKAGVEKLVEGLPKCTVTSDFGVIEPKK